MIIGFVGDIHGRACHALAILVRWQSMRERPFDLVVQVGDLGVMPLPVSEEIPYDEFSQWDPAVYDFCDLILAKRKDARLAREIRAQLPSSILVLAGNHDDFTAVRSSANVKPSEPVPLDPHGLFHCVPDGFTIAIGGQTVGFSERGDPQTLQHLGKVDVFVSHSGGFGVGADANGLREGSQDLLEYLEASKPNFHVFGHLHQPIGPLMVHDTQCVQLASIVSNPRDPTLQVINAGCIGALDTDTGDFELVSGDWLSTYQREGGFRLLADTLDKVNG